MDVQQTCRITGKEFLVTEAEQTHLVRMAEHSKVLQEPLPLPTIHPFEAIRRFAYFSNNMTLFKRESAFSGKPTLSVFSPESPCKVCTLDELWTDQIDNREFGRAYDFSRPFFEQWYELFCDVYHQPLWNVENENSDFVSGTKWVKNCYLCFAALESQDSLYCLHLMNSNDCIDCVGAVRSQYCYGCVDIENCYECQHCQDCENCHSCFGSLDLIGCNNCFGCVGLRQQSYCIYNEQKTKEAYQEFLDGLTLGNRARRNETVATCNSFIETQAHTVNRITHCENSSGAYLKNCQNAYQCFQAEKLQDCGYVFFGYSGQDCWRACVVDGELGYGSDLINARLGMYNYGMDGGEECISCFNALKSCHFCFGCCVLRGKSYCILNKQYTKEEYFELVPRIIEQRKAMGDWGEFFPIEYSPHTYQDSLLDEWFAPLPLEEAALRGYRIGPSTDSEIVEGAIEAGQLPENIDQVEVQQVLGKSLRCSETGRAFNLQKQEVEFYQRHSIPLPEVHWRTRIHALISKRELMPAA